MAAQENRIHTARKRAMESREQMSGKTGGDDREHAAAITGAGAEWLARELLEREEDARRRGTA